MIRLLSLFFLCIGIAQSFQNSFLVEALIKAGNCSQAYLVLSREEESSARFDLYKGSVLFCMGRLEEGLRWMDIARAETSLAQNPSLSQALLEYVKTRSLPSTTLKKLVDMNFPLPSKPQGPWLSVYLSALSKEGAHSEVLANAPQIPDAESLNLMAVSHEALGSARDWILSLVEPEVFRSQPLENKVILIRFLYEKVDRSKALELFAGLANLSNQSVTDLLLYVGHREKNNQWIEKAYLRRMESKPHDIVTARDLASFWFSQERFQEAETLLIQVLQINSNSISVAREVAQIFLDFNREDRLVEFVKAYRQKIRAPLILSDVLLHLFGSRGKEENFFSELFSRFGQEDGFLLGERMLDYIPLTQMPQFLKRAYDDSDSLAMKMILAILNKNPQFDFLQLKLEFQQDVVLRAVHDALNRNLVSSSKLFVESLPYQNSSEFLGIRIDIAHRQKDYVRLDRLVRNLSETERSQNPRFNLLWLDALMHLEGTSREALRLFRLYRKDLLESSQGHYGDPNTLVIALKHMIQAGQLAEATKRLEVLKSVLGAEDYAYLEILLSLRSSALGDALLKIRNFMDNRMSSRWFVELQPWNILLLPMKDYLDNEILLKLVQLEFSALAGDLEELEQGIMQLSNSEIAEELGFLFPERILWLKLFAQSLRIRKASGDVALRDEMQKWVALGRELFEKFPDSFYTPNTVRSLVPMYLELWLSGRVCARPGTRQHL